MLRAVERLEWRGDAQLDVTEVVGIHGQVGMRVDEPGKDSQARQIDGPGGRTGCGSDGNDFVAFNRDRLSREVAARFHIENFSREDDDARWRGNDLGEAAGSEQQEQRGKV